MQSALVACCLALSVAQDASALDRALSRLYNFDFAGAHRILDSKIGVNPSDPLPYAFRGSALLFQELDRLKILESDFFGSDKRISDKKIKMTPDPAIRQRFYDSLREAENRAKTRLAEKPNDPDAMFALSLTAGLAADYTALVEKRQIASLSQVKQSHNLALALLKIHPTYTDAFLTTGVSEYLLGSLPFFVRWFVKFDDTEGSKKTAARKLERVAEAGRYLRPFSKILLAVLHLREKRFDKSERYLAELVHEFPENPLFRKELARMSSLRAARER